MSTGTKKWLRFTVRWGIAAVGVYWVLANISLHDCVLVADAKDGWPVSVKLARPAGEQDQTFAIVGEDGTERMIPRTDLIARADRPTVVLQGDVQATTYAVLGLKVSEGAVRSQWPLIVAPPRNLWDRYWDVHNATAMVVQPDPYKVLVSYPLIDVGINHMLRNADVRLLAAAVAVFPLTYLLTSWRWFRLLEALALGITLARTFVLNMVGCFYSTFMPGSTGGDLLKAYYAAKNVPQYRTRAVMSVIVDRAIGLLALIILGGAMAALGYATSANRFDPASIKCRQVALASALILTATAAGLFVFYRPVLRRVLGMDWLAGKLPMQAQVRKAAEVMEIYRQRPGLIAWSILITLPVHVTTVVSALLAGKAFGLPISGAFYFVVVPVIVLVGAIPISPQGAGVMEFFAILLTRSQGATVSQAVALTMSIRMLQILWNLTGGIFVLRGGYHAPTAVEQHAIEKVGAATSPVANRT